MIRFDRFPFAQLTLIAAACVLLAGCPSGGTSSATSTPAPSSGGTSTVTSTTPSGGTSSSTSGSTTSTSGSTGGTSGSTTPPPAPTPPPTKSVTLSWVAPTLNTDGTILNDLAGYTINYGTSPTALTQTATVTGATSTTYTIGNLTSGTYYFSVTAYSSLGTQSAPSATVSTTI